MGAWTTVALGFCALAFAAERAWESRRVARGTMPRVLRWGSAAFPWVALALAARALVAEPFMIPSSSMAPTLEPGDYALGTREHGVETPWGKLGGWAPSRGEVAIFRCPGQPSQYCIKRVVAVGGDTIRFSPAGWMVNGEMAKAAPTGLCRKETESGPCAPLEREELWGRQWLRVASNGRDWPGAWAPGAGRESGACKELEPATQVWECAVPAGMVFALGDNRPESDDSRHYGLVEESEIVARARVVVFSARGLQWRWL